MPELAAMRWNPDLKEKYEQMRAAGKPAKVAIVAIMRKLIEVANALVKANRKWTPKTALSRQILWTYDDERPKMGIGGITPAQKLLPKGREATKWPLKFYKCASLKTGGLPFDRDQLLHSEKPDLQSVLQIPSLRSRQSIHHGADVVPNPVDEAHYRHCGRCALGRSRRDTGSHIPARSIPWRDGENRRSWRCAYPKPEWRQMRKAISLATVEVKFS